MTMDVKVQFFSHLNGLNLDNNWGDLIRLLDATLVNGVPLPVITAASIDEQGDVRLTFSVEHKALLFQVVELTDFSPESLNQKYRIKGVPNATSLILKPETSLSDTMISSRGTAKLASLGYEIIFRDVNDVKRVYRAQNPTAQHPFIRVDETISNLDGAYAETYAKYAMVGLLENMTHIDDYANPDVLQLPFDPSDPAKNWKITGTGTAVVRGWSRWYYTRSSFNGNSADSYSINNGLRRFTLVGDVDAFYFVRNILNTDNNKTISGCGLFKDAIDQNMVPNWFLMTALGDMDAATTRSIATLSGGTPLAGNTDAIRQFFIPKFNQTQIISNHVAAIPMVHATLQSGRTNTFANALAALNVPFYDADNYLRGTVLHACLNGNNKFTITNTTPLQSGNHIYVGDAVYVTTNSVGSLLFYLGELD